MIINPFLDPDDAVKDFEMIQELVKRHAFAPEPAARLVRLRRDIRAGRIRDDGHDEPIREERKP